MIYFLKEIYIDTFKDGFIGYIFGIVFWMLTIMVLFASFSLVFTIIDKSSSLMFLR